MPSEQHETFAMILAAAKVTPDADLSESRTGYDMLGDMLAPTEGVTATEATLAGVSVQRVVPDGAFDATVLYLHGGGYSIGSHRSHRALTAQLARSAKAEVVVVDYRRAPEDPYPAALDDAVAVYEALLGAGVAPQTLALAGDSAGGGLAVSTLLCARDRAMPVATCAALFSPWMDMRPIGPVAIPDEDDPILSRELAAHWASLYAGSTPLDDPALSPLFAALAGLPDLYLTVGTRELFLPQVQAFADAAISAGVRVELEIGDGLVHHWPIFGDSVPEASLTLARVGAWIAQHTNPV